MASKNPSKRRRVEITASVKKEIAREKERNPSLTQTDLQRLAESKFEIKIGRSTIGDILREKQKWLACDDGSQ